jgi:hypothetical protein
MNPAEKHQIVKSNIVRIFSSLLVEIMFMWANINVNINIAAYMGI